MARFFIAGTNFPNGRAIIRGRDADHIRVLRLRAGDDIVICDGAGRDYKCRLVQTLEHEAEAEVIEVVPCKAEPTVRTTVFAGLPKGERSDFLVQKCTEAGAAEIVFFSCTQGRQYRKEGRALAAHRRGGGKAVGTRHHSAGALHGGLCQCAQRRAAHRSAAVHV